MKKLLDTIATFILIISASGLAVITIFLLFCLNVFFALATALCILSIVWIILREGMVI